MSDYTAQELLEAVGVAPDAEPGWLQWRLFANFGTEYIGPEVGTPELDAILLVEGQRWLVNQQHTEVRSVAKLLPPAGFEEDSAGWVSGRIGLAFLVGSTGHALARAIKEARK